MRQSSFKIKSAEIFYFCRPNWKSTMHKILFDTYNDYLENYVSSERITHKEVLKFTERIKHSGKFIVKKLGNSIEGRDINLISIGCGETKILAWTQMHGDEPTATAAVFDVLNFLAADDDLNDFRDFLISNLQINFIPMLNPDGAEKYKRENFINIDINRDALRNETPEAKILLNAANEIKPDFGFNLHDQNSYYTAGKVNKTAAVSLLAPPINFNKEINAARERSMKLICEISEILSNYIPEQIARYNDDFEPRAFGDNFTKMGISSILIESGFHIGDNDKSFLRKLNFVALLSAFKSIAEKNYERFNSKEYFNIPENESLLFDVLLRNLTLKTNGNNFKIDIGINREKCFDEKTNSFYYKGKIEQVGDLSIYYGLEEHDFNNYEVSLPVSILRSVNKNQLNKIDFKDLYSAEITCIHLEGTGVNEKFTKLPINITYNEHLKDYEIRNDEPANLIIKDKEIVKYVVVNGFFYDINNSTNSIYNGLVID